MPRPIRATISASALAHNLSVARQHAGQAKVWAVIKANAYGHGLERAAKGFAAADGLAVLDFQEAARLRIAGITQPILMLEGIFKPSDVALLDKYALTPVIQANVFNKNVQGANQTVGSSALFDKVWIAS